MYVCARHGHGHGGHGRARGEGGKTIIQTNQPPKGFGVADFDEVTLLKQVSYGGSPVEVAWALGNALSVMK